MDRSTTIAVVIAVIVLFFSMTLTADTDTVFAPFQNQLDTTQHFTISGPLVLGISVQSSPELNQSTRAEIYCLVQNNPGINFRGICNSLCLPVGMVQYHAGILVSAGFLSVYCDGKMQRYFEAGKYSSKQMKIISLLRHKTKGIILKIIAEKKTAEHGQLAEELSITSQGMTWQIHHLEKEGVIEEIHNGLKLTYFINETYEATVNELVRVVA